MKTFLTIFASVGVCLFSAQGQIISPYATTTAEALNQLANDALNGSLAIAVPATTNNLAILTDATTPTTPTGSVIVGPDSSATTTLSWDLGALLNPSLRRLDLFSIWIADDLDRLGFNGSLATSVDGTTYTPIANSLHVVGWNQAPGSFHHILYDFTGTNVSNFRFVRLASSGFLDVNNNSTLQPRLVEIDLSFTTIPEPSTIALLLGGASIGLVSLLRKKR